MSDKPIDWRPIESAPRDGRWILLWDDRACAAVSGGWDPEVEAWITDVDVCDGDFLPTLWLPVPHPTLSEGVFDECGWQPIETAPCDGTSILVWDAAGKRVVFGCWYYPWGEWQNSHTLRQIKRPTHWMLMPGEPLRRRGRDE